MLKKYKLYFIYLLLALSCPLSAQATDAPLQYRILSFPGKNLWQGTETTLSPTSNGRLETTNTNPHYSGGNCGDLLQNFQEAPLNKMVKDGYITPQMREELLKMIERGIEPQQLVLFSQFSDIPRALALKIFNGKIPEERSSMADPESGRDKVRINRGTLYYVRGFRPELSATGRLILEPRKLPWENGDTFPSQLHEFKRDSSGVIEIGRLFMEKGELPGKINPAVHVLIAYLANEARALKLDPEKFVLTAHTMDPPHAKVFTRQFPLRILTPEIQAQMAQNSFSLNEYMDLSLPKKQEWPEYKDNVLFGSLSQFVKIYPPEKLSATAAKIASASNGKISEENALELIQIMGTQFRTIYKVNKEIYPEAKYPIAGFDFGSTFLEASSTMALARAGVKEGISGAENFMEKIDLNFGDPDIASADQVDRMLHVPLDWEKPSSDGETMDARKALMISNFDPNLVKAYPQKFIADVLVSYMGQLKHKLDNLMPEAYRLNLESLNRLRREKGMPAANDLELATYLDSVEVLVASTDPNVNKQAEQLGGKKVQGLSIQFIVPSGPDVKALQLEARQIPTHYWRFDSAAYQKLLELHGSANSKTLKPDIYNYLIRMAMAGVF